MTEVHSLLRKASFRLALGRIARWCVLTLTIAIVALTLLLIAERLFALSVSWSWPLIVGAAGALVVGSAIALLRWPSRLDVARDVDERASLREAISTAVCVQALDDAWSKAAVEHARSAASSVSLRTAMPARAPRTWPAPLIAIGALGFLWLVLPQWDLLGHLAEAQKQARREQVLQQAIEQVKVADETIKDAMAAIGQQPEPGAPDTDPEFTPPEDPEAIRQMAVKRLTDASDRLVEARRSADGQMLDALRDSMSRLRRTGEGPLNEVTKALQQGDFKGAGEELNKLLEQMASDGLSDGQLEQLAEQLENLAQQMQQLADRQDALEQSLSNMGLDPSLASNPDALRDSIQNAPGLTDAQRQALQQALEGMEMSQGLLQQMAQAANNAASQCRNPGATSGQQGQQGVQQMAGQLSELEMLQAEMAQIDAACQGVWGQLSRLNVQQAQGGGGGSENMLQLWDRTMAGNGASRGPGGGDFDASQAQFNVTKEKSVGQDLGGPTIGTRLVEGDQVVGESRAQFVEAVRSGAQSAEDAIESQRIPREFHDAVKHYFGRLDAKARGEEYVPPAEGESEAESESGGEGETTGGSN